MISFHKPFHILFCTSSSQTIYLLVPSADFELLTQNSEVQSDKYSFNSIHHCENSVVRHLSQVGDRNAAISKYVLHILKFWV